LFTNENKKALESYRYPTQLEANEKTKKQKVRHIPDNYRLNSANKVPLSSLTAGVFGE